MAIAMLDWVAEVVCNEQVMKHKRAGAKLPRLVCASAALGNSGRRGACSASRPVLLPKQAWPENRAALFKVRPAGRLDCEELASGGA